MRAFQRLHNVHTAYKVWCALWPDIKTHLASGGPALRVSIQPDSRSLEQNDKFHVMCEDLAKSGLKWQGKPRTKDQWKVLLVSGHAIATGEGSDMVPGIEGEFVNIRESTAQMSVRRSSSLIDYTQAFGDLQGVQWRDRAVEEQT